MAMRYHWGLGIGHTYSHEKLVSIGSEVCTEPDVADKDDASETEEIDLSPVNVTQIPAELQAHDGDDSEGSDSDAEPNLGLPPTAAAQVRDDMDSEDDEVYSTYYDGSSD